MNTSSDPDIIGGAHYAPNTPNADIIGGTGPLADKPAASSPSADTLDERLAAATRVGGLTDCPPDYSDKEDWRTVADTANPFRQLYLDYRQYAAISDRQVQANAQVLLAFWEGRRKMLIRGGDRLKARFGEGTIEKAPAQLEKAAEALADASRRQAYFTQIENRRLQAATEITSAYLTRILAATENVMKPRTIQDVLEEGAKHGFTQWEAENHLLTAMRQAGLKPIKTTTQLSNPLLTTWTPDGQALTGQPHTKVMGHDVYNLAEAAQVLYNALSGTTERGKALRNLDSSEYLSGIAQDLKERDVQQDIGDLFRRVGLPKAQRRLAALYLLGPGLPFYLEGLPAFASPAELLTRVARSAQDFGAAEAAFTAGLLPIWLRAAGTAEVKVILPAKTTSLDFRSFLHKADPTFPLWIGREAFTSPAQLATYIQRDEHTWKMVYGSLAAGNLAPWLSALGQANLLERQAQLVDVLLGPGLEPTSEPGRYLAVQALLEALDPRTAVPTLGTDLSVVDLTGLSGETQAQRTLTFTNEAGGAVRVFLALEPPVEGVSFSPHELFFDQRAPGQKLPVLLTGNPSLMPRDGQHTAQLTVRTAYVAGGVPVQAGAVFPQKQFWQFVVGAALAMATIFGGTRFLLGLMLDESNYEGMLSRGELLPLNRAVEAGNAPVLVVSLLLLGGLLYGFWRVLAKLSKPQSAA